MSHLQVEMKRLGSAFALGLRRPAAVGAMPATRCVSAGRRVTSEAKDMEALWTWSVIAALVVGLRLDRDLLDHHFPPAQRR